MTTNSWFEKHEKGLYVGTLPSPVAMNNGAALADPLFVDVRYAHPHSVLSEDWVLHDEHVELTELAQPAEMLVFEERPPVTATIAHVLESAFLTKQRTDSDGQLVIGATPPPGVGPEAFCDLDVLSAPLTHFDSLLTGFARVARATEPACASAPAPCASTTSSSSTSSATRRGWGASQPGQARPMQPIRRPAGAATTGRSRPAAALLGEARLPLDVRQRRRGRGDGDRAAHLRPAGPRLRRARA